MRNTFAANEIGPLKVTVCLRQSNRSARLRGYPGFGGVTPSGNVAKK